MKKTVSIVDYGMGNLFSVSRAVEHCGAEPLLVSTASEIEKARWLILPGVGAFADGMAGLKAGGLVEPLRRHAAEQKPFLGICLGMQMMMEWSLEFGRHEGLSIIAGGVIPLPAQDQSGTPHKVPLIGWSGLEVPSGRAGWDGTILRNTPAGTAAYFVHSFMATPVQSGDRLAETDYGGVKVCAAISHGSASGCQFHPEKSGEAGLAILRTFLENQG